MSESIHAGYLPLWNPYINFGIPQYGDMSSGYWSPVTWLIASTVGYNAYTLTIEVLFYILLGGIGVYKLTGFWKLEKNVRIIAGIAFMCSGFNIGHLQHFNWLSGAALLPWCFWSYLKLFKHFSLKTAVLNALLFYGLVSSAHPGITISACYFFLAILIFYFFINEDKLTLQVRFSLLGRANLIFLLLFSLLSAGMIAGYLDILPYFVRGDKISIADSLANTTSVQSWISTLLPFSTVKNDPLFNTDLTMRNCYFSITLLMFFLLAIFNKKTSWQKFLFIAGLFFALLSAGGIFKTFAYNYLPFVGYVRLNGEFRIFSLLCFILAASIELNSFVQQKKKFEGVVKWIYYGLEIILFTCICFGAYKAITGQNSMFHNLKNISHEAGLASKLKALVDGISFYDTLWIQGSIQLFILWSIKWAIRSDKLNLLKRIVVADMIIACLLNIPYTGVGKASVAQVQSVLDRSPKGIPTPALQSLLLNDTLSTKEKDLVGDWSMYNKQIGVKQEVAYPVALKNMAAYFEKSKISNDSLYINDPFIFFTDPGRNTLAINKFSPDKIETNIFSDSTTMIVLKQNFYPHWYYQSSTEKKPMIPFGLNFMGAPVAKGQGEIKFSFEPTLVKWSMTISLTVFILYCLLLFILRSKPPSPS